MKRLKPAEMFFKRESQSQTRSSTESDKSEGIEVVPGQYGSKFISSKLGNSAKPAVKGYNSENIRNILISCKVFLHGVLFEIIMCAIMAKASSPKFTSVLRVIAAFSLYMLILSANILRLVFILYGFDITLLTCFCQLCQCYSLHYNESYFFY